MHRTWRSPPYAIGIAFAIGIAAVTSTAAKNLSAQSTRTTAVSSDLPGLELFEQYCYRCHGGTRQRAGIDLESLTTELPLVRNRETWGRVIAAAGNAEVEMSEAATRVWFNTHLVAEAGMAVEQDLSEATKELEADEVSVRIDLGVGSASATVWTCDLTEDYIRINGSYIS